MIYIENIFVCMATPMIMSMLCLSRKKRKYLLFLLTGMAMCLLSAYINSFFAQFYGVDSVVTAIEIAPFVEEVMKLLPILFFLAVFEPKKEEAASAVLLVAAGFATFENVCFMVEHGASQIQEVIARGFGAGAMHIVCAIPVSYGLIYTWKHTWLKVGGTLGLLSAAVTMHAIFNLLICAGGTAQMIGYLVPSVFILLGNSIIKRLIGQKTPK